MMDLYNRMLTNRVALKGGYNFYDGKPENSDDYSEESNAYKSDKGYTKEKGWYK